MKKHRAAQQTRPCVSLDDVNRLAVLPATLPATAVELLIVLAAAAAALPARILVAAALPATLTTLTTLTALLLAVALSGIARVRASHRSSQCKRSIATLATAFSNVAPPRRRTHPPRG